MRTEEFTELEKKLGNREGVRDACRKAISESSLVINCEEVLKQQYFMTPARFVTIVAKKIEESAFAYSKSLAVVDITAEKICARAFLECEELTTVQIKGATVIERDAFAECNKLKEVIVHGHPAMHTDAFPKNVNVIFK